MKSADVGRGAVAGLLGGLLAAGAMSLAHRLLTDPDTQAAQSAGPEDPTIKVASAATCLAGYRLRKEHKAAAGSIGHYAFAAAAAAGYGAAPRIARMAKIALGLPFGTAVWLGAHVVAVPALGLAESPARQPLGKEAGEFGLHLLYGSVTGLVYRLLRR